MRTIARGRESGAYLHGIAALALVAAVVGNVPAAGAASQFEVGREALLAGRYQDAIGAFRTHLTQHPKDADAWGWLGASYYQLGSLGSAIAAFEQTMALRPSGEVALWLGAAYAQAGNAEEARVAFIRATHSSKPQTVLLARQWLRAASVHKEAILAGDPSLDAYAYVIRWYNPRLESTQVEAIARSVLHYSSAYRVDPRLVMALIIVESGFQIDARSPAGAYGLGQLMPETAQAMGINPADPVGNVYGTVRFLRAALERFGGDPQLALAAYNAGHHAVSKYNGIPPFSETQWYVYNVMTLYRHLSGN
jgi:soluble lytic murein transglycosylase-like protein